MGDGFAVTNRKLTPHQNAVRVLFILKWGAVPLVPVGSDGAVAAFQGEARLHALDFWVRNPDYLAHELLDLYATTKDRTLLDKVEAIFADEEPDLRHYPMIRYRFGAYERIDNTLSVLVSRGLVRIVSEIQGGRVVETEFRLMPVALTLADSIVVEFPGLVWYAERAGLVATIAGARGGSALKLRQYEQLEYAKTELGRTIPSITARVKDRLEALKRSL